MKNLIFVHWPTEKKCVLLVLTEEIRKKRCEITTDTWNSTAKRGYMVISVYYIHEDWQLKSVIIAFTSIIYPHTGEQLAISLIKVMHVNDPAHLSSVWAIVADNTSYN